MTKPKAIFFVKKYPFINSTYDLLFECIESIFDVVFYGPGHIPDKDLVSDVSNVFRNLGPFDAAFIHDSVYLNPEEKWLEDLFDPRIVKGFGKNFNKIPGEKFLFCRTDPYACSKAERDAILRFPGYVFALPLYLIASNEFLAVLAKRENFPFKATKHYEEALLKREKDIIPLSPIIGETEFKDPAAYFKFDISVPGVLYYERRKIYNLLRQTAGIRTINRYTFLKGLHFFERITGWRFVNNRLSIWLQKWLFRKIIHESFATYTDGSQFKYPVRKFFEIPALGSILLATPFEHHERLGFKEGEHFLSATHENILPVYEKIKQDQKYADQLRKNAQELILKNHSKKAWIEYLTEIFDSIKKDTFDGCEWKNGTIHVYKKKPNK